MHAWSKIDANKPGLSMFIVYNYYTYRSKCYSTNTEQCSSQYLQEGTYVYNHLAISVWVAACNSYIIIKPLINIIPFNTQAPTVAARIIIVSVRVTLGNTIDNIQHSVNVKHPQTRMVYGEFLIQSLSCLHPCRTEQAYSF